MNVKCPRCPVVGHCHGEDHFPFFCAWAMDGDPVHLQHIRLRSAIPYEPPPAVAAVADEAPPPSPTPPPAEGPSFFNKAVNFGKAIVTHALAGLPEVDEATHESRLATCRACEMFDAEGVTCRACGCFLFVKTRWRNERCPIGKW